MPEGGLLLIEGRHEAENDVIEFMDTGPGIPPEVCDRLFDPLVTTKTRGTGLGLTICQQIVTAHGGTISACAREGGGTCIRIELPRA
jgi:signal transduction histidine kinase